MSREALVEQIIRDYDSIDSDYPPSKWFYVERILSYKEAIQELNNMNEREQKYATLFNKKQMLVKDMDLLQIRAFREEMESIAFEAKVSIYAADEREKALLKQNKPSKPTGFQRNVNVDETTTNAINAVKDRQKKLSKADKIREGLLKLGIDPAAADKILSARNIQTELSKPKVVNTKKPNAQMDKVWQPIRISEAVEQIMKIEPKVPAKPVNNPFARQAEKKA
jgi:hypothetical protein